MQVTLGQVAVLNADWFIFVRLLSGPRKLKFCFWRVGRNILAFILNDYCSVFENVSAQNNCFFHTNTYFGGAVF